jgi:hypothetical protein
MMREWPGYDAMMIQVWGHHMLLWWGVGVGGEFEDFHH